MQAVNALVSVFSRVKDRDDYAKCLDAEAERTQQDRPVVRIRKLEPTGLNHLIGAQIKAKQYNAARKNLQTLEETKWPSRFGSVRSWVDRHKRELKSK
jgi:hypothetical protein